MQKIRLTALLSALVLLFASLPSAAAYRAGTLLPQVNSGAAPFADTKDAWCRDYVQTVYETGLMAGTAPGTFAPAASLTNGQIIVITARLHELLQGGDGKFDAPAAGEAWYDPALNYLNGLWETDETGQYEELDFALWLASGAPDRPCDRYTFVWLLSGILPDSALVPINSVTALPDVSGDRDVLRFYNAGILTGCDQYGTFRGEDTVSRGQAAAMLARIADPALRVNFTPASFSYARELLGLDPAAVVLTIDGYGVSAELYAAVVSDNIAAWKTEAAYSCYDIYARYLEEYFDDEVYYQYDSFPDFLLQKYGIDTRKECVVLWDVPDQGGMTPAQKVVEDTLSQLKQAAMLFTHADAYPLTSSQKVLLDADCGDFSGILDNSYGFSDAFLRELAMGEMLLDNMSQRYIPSRSDLNRYLAENGYFYGRCLSIRYGGENNSLWSASRGENGSLSLHFGGENSLSGLTEAEARSLAQTLRQKAAANLSDPDYFGYLCWKYGDWSSQEESGLISVDGLSKAQQTALQDLSPGLLSGVMQVKNDDSSGSFVIYWKDDPSENSLLVESFGGMAAEIQLTKWAETASVTTTPAYDGFRIAELAARYDQLPTADASGL